MRQGKAKLNIMQMATKEAVQGLTVWLAVKQFQGTQQEWQSMTQAQAQTQEDHPGVTKNVPKGNTISAEGFSIMK